MDDLISRQWLVEAVDDGWVKFDTEKDYNRYIHLIRDIAPSVQPERKKGRWRRRLVDSGFNADWHCSECGWKTSLEEHEYNFCPNCGADMRGEEDYDYERSVDQLEHDITYEPTFNPEDGSM